MNSMSRLHFFFLTSVDHFFLNKQVIIFINVALNSLFAPVFISKLNNLKRGVRQDMASPFFDRLVFNKVSIK